MKNLKIKAVYTPIQDEPEFNIFREILINFNACEITIKDVNYDEFSKNLINFNFNENIYKFNNDDEIILNLCNVIKNYINDDSYYNNEKILNNTIECLFYHIISQYNGDDLTFYRVYLDR